MENKKKTNYWLIAIALIILLIGGYYSYLDIEYARTHGVYTIATVTKERMGKNGWKSHAVLSYQHKQYNYETLVDWEVFSFGDVTPKRFFAKILEDAPEDGFWSVYIMEVPDSIQSAPPEGWSEEWMKIHFPKVVEDVYDTR